MAASADGATIYVLGKGPRLWRITGANVQRIANVPALLFGGDEGRTETGMPGGARAQPLDTNEPTSNQSHYDMAIAVHPDHADQLVLGGAAIETSNAALFKCTVGGPANAPRLDYNPANDPKPATPDGTAGSDLTFIGRGVHADVHGVTFAKRGDVVDVWVACDGGVYRSTTGGGNYTWQTRNNGLAVIEPGYLACHPLNESVIVVGTQDNGVLRRTGDTAWMWELAGDGGGVAFHPKQTHRYMAQSTAAGWRDNAPVNGMKEPILRNWPWLKAQKDENNKANFYSSPGVVAATNTEGARIAIGTNRVWVSENFGKFWVTLTSQSDPQLPQVGNTDRDVKYDDYRDRVLACRWLNENDLFVLCDRSIQRFVRTPGGPATWDRTVVTDHKNKCSAYTESDIDGTRMDYLPPLGDWADIAFKPGAADVATTLYVACVGHNSAPKMDTLWWFDGNKTWYATGLRFGVKAPALAVAVHPTDPTTVFVGTTIGVYQGKFQPDVGGGVPAWQFFEFSKGLPEAAVQDLAFFYDPAEPLLLLRAALQSRGVWEVDLLGPCDEKTYLRAHGYDSRRRAQTSLVDPSGPSTFGPLDQFASPDILVRPRPPADAASTPGPPAILPIDASHHSRSGSLWTFQTAFRAVEPRCRPTGRWSKAFESQLVAYKKKPENALGAAPVIDAATWTNVVTQARVWQQPWDGPAPTEADFLQLVMDDDDETPPVQFSQRHLAVHVMAHQRGLQPLKIIEVLVVLLIRRMVEGEALWPGLSIDDAWKTQTVAALTGGIIPADGHWPSGDWAAANPATPTRNLAAPIDAMHPQVATFDVNFPDTVTDEQYLLLAVCSSETATITNARLPGATLGELIVRSPHVAAHRLHILT